MGGLGAWQAAVEDLALRVAADTGGEQGKHGEQGDRRFQRVLTRARRHLPTLAFRMRRYDQCAPP